MVGELPTTGSGKVLKTELRSQCSLRPAPTMAVALPAPPQSDGANIAGIARQIAALCGGADVSVLGGEGAAGGGLVGCVALVTTADSALSDVSVA